MSDQASDIHKHYTYILDLQELMQKPLVDLEWYYNIILEHCLKYSLLVHLELCMLLVTVMVQ